MNVVILDTEGLGAATATQEHDARIFALSVLLCSVLVFNSKDAITEDAIRMLSFVTKLSSHIQMDAAVHSDAATAHTSATGFLPSFVWLIRDFGLQLVDEDGDDITANQYLENCLTASSAGASTGGNKTREAIKAHFRTRNCVPLLRPADSEAVLQRLEHATTSELRKEFIVGLCDLRWRLLGAPPSEAEQSACGDSLQLSPSAQAEFCRIKSMHGTQLSGPMLLGLLHQYIDTVNSGAVPSLGSAWGSVARATCEQAAKSAVSGLRAWLKQLQTKRFTSGSCAPGPGAAGEATTASLPQLPSQLHRAVVQLRHRAMCTFRKQVDSLAAAAAVDTSQLVWGSELHPSLPAVSDGGSVLPQPLFPQYAPKGHRALFGAVQSQYESDAQSAIPPSALGDQVYSVDCRLAGEAPQLPAMLPEDTAQIIRTCMQFVGDYAAFIALEAFRANVKAAHLACKDCVNERMRAFLQERHADHTAELSYSKPSQEGSGGAISIAAVLKSSQASLVSTLQGHVDPIILAAHSAAMMSDLVPRAHAAAEQQHKGALLAVRTVGEERVSTHARSQESAKQSSAALQEHIQAARCSSEDTAAQLMQAQAKLEALQGREAQLQADLQAALTAQAAQADDSSLRLLRQELWEAEQALPPGFTADTSGAGSAGAGINATAASQAPEAPRKPQVLTIKRVETPPAAAVQSLPARSVSGAADK